MSDQQQQSSSVDPFVLARRMEQAARAHAILDASINSDLRHAGLPPTGAALVASKGGADGWPAAVEVAWWWLDVVKRAGLADAARDLYAAAHKRGITPEGEHAWSTRELAARELVRRALSHEADALALHLGDDDADAR